MVRGQLYYFDVNAVSSSHPIALRLSSGNTSVVSGTIGNDPTSGTYGNIIIYRVPYDAPSSLVYQCVFHSGMIGTINVVDLNGYIGSQGTTGYTGSQGDVGYAGSQGVGYTGSSAAITVSLIDSGANVSNAVSNVSTIRFDSDSGFDVTDLGSGAVKVAMNSTFKNWEVDGQPTLVASGLDTIEFIAGNNISITTNVNSSPKSLTINSTASGSGPTNWIYKNSNYTAAIGDRIIADTGSGAFTITLPLTPGLGNSVVITAGSSFSSNNVTVARNGSTIENISDDVLLDINNTTYEFIYSGSTWQITATSGPIGYTGSSGGIGIGKAIAMAIVFGG